MCTILTRRYTFFSAILLHLAILFYDFQSASKIVYKKSPEKPT